MLLDIWERKAATPPQARLGVTASLAVEIPVVDLPERAAKNEEVFRDVNSLIEQGAERLGVDSRVPFHCECANASCTETVDLTPAEYDRIATHRFRFVVQPGHERADVESVVSANEWYVVVEKQGEAREQVDQDHPRERHRE